MENEAENRKNLEAKFLARSLNASPVISSLVMSIAASERNVVA